MCERAKGQNTLCIVCVSEYVEREREVVWKERETEIV